MEQIKKYIRGNSERGKEVIAELEKLGGENYYLSEGTVEEIIYFIDKNNSNRIVYAYKDTLLCEFIVEHWEEIELPKHKYPKTYEECCKVMNYCYNPKAVKTIHKEELIRKFQFLLLYRDVYWKIAGEEMGLGKAWEPDWTNDNLKYCIRTICNDIGVFLELNIRCILSFPTEEMRDAFYENFKNEIEQCKELL